VDRVVLKLFRRRERTRQSPNLTGWSAVPPRNSDLWRTWKSDSLGDYLNVRWDTLVTKWEPSHVNLICSVLHLRYFTVELVEYCLRMINAQLPRFAADSRVVRDRYLDFYDIQIQVSQHSMGFRTKGYYKTRGGTSKAFGVRVRSGQTTLTFRIQRHRRTRNWANEKTTRNCGT